VTTTSDPAAELRPLTAQLPTGEYLADMWARRDFVVAMPREQLRAAHQDTLLGNIWHLGNPLLSTAVYYLVFGVLLGADRGVDNFVLWLTVGVFTFGLTSSTVTRGARAISNNAGLMRAIRFPRALLPISVILSLLMSFVFQLVVIGGVAVLTGEGLSPRRLVFLPGVLLVHTAFNAGGAFVAARLNDAFRDVEQIIPFVFRLLIYVSGVMFPIEGRLGGAEAPSVIVQLVRLNPLVPLIDMYRWVFLGTPVALDHMVYAIAFSFGLLVFGFWYFRGAEMRYGRG
jgi:teichoic acid transport system permease protein